MWLRKYFILLMLAGLPGCESMPDIPGLPVISGSEGAESAASGSAAGSSTSDANSELARCNRPFGTMGIIERHDGWYYWMHSHYGVESTVPILRLIAQQSNCFVIVERSRSGLDAAMTERDLEASGELRSNSNFQKGQMAAADYTLNPAMIFRENNTGGLGAALGGLFGSVGAMMGGSIDIKQAQALLTLVDNRSSVQVAASEGSAQGFDLSGFGKRYGSRWSALDAYTRTPESKVVVAALFDAYNVMVTSLKNYKPQQSATGQGHGSGGTLDVN